MGHIGWTVKNEYVHDHIVSTFLITTFPAWTHCDRKTLGNIKKKTPDISLLGGDCVNNLCRSYATTIKLVKHITSKQCMEPDA